MLKKIARWILIDELRLTNEMYAMQICELQDHYKKRIKEIEDQHKKELELFIGSRK